MELLWKVDQGSKIKLKDYDPGYTDKQNDRASAETALQTLSDELSELGSSLKKVSLLVYG